MSTRFSLLLCLFCFVFLGACAPKRATVPSFATRFPHQPMATLAKTPEQSLHGTVSRKNVQVTGGWGYKRNDAFRLTLPGRQNKNAYNNTIPLENILVRNRNEVEFSQTPPQGQRYLVVNQGTIARTVSMQEGRMYAVWRGQMIVLAERDAPALYKEMAGKPLAQRATSATMVKARAVPREYWFDVTDTFNARHAVKTAESTKRAQPAAKMNQPERKKKTPQ